ncbi:hypothetical protein HJFPF1_09540 [Paramyrothecium foliicola]|nr:hypothetical protein HJFPF1_09540 [Paramyrothecium foliicola]
MSMAMHNNTQSGVALFNAMLAFASLRLHGITQEGLLFKISALRLLSASMTDGAPSPTKAMQHIAVSMLLVASDIFSPSESSAEWLYHIWGVMNMIQATNLGPYSDTSDANHLLDWVYYHDTVSRFSVNHWRRETSWLKKAAGSRNNSEKYINYPLVKHNPSPISPNPSHAIMNLLSEVCDTIIDPQDPRSRHGHYRERLGQLKRSLDDISSKNLSMKFANNSTMALGLYQVATRVYLARATQTLWETETAIDPLIDAAFDGPLQSCTSCEHLFPLLILASEARKQEHRTAILNLIDRTSRDSRIRSVQGVKAAIQCIWVQQDLHADTELLVNYVGLMNAAISASGKSPSLA